MPTERAAAHRGSPAGPDQQAWPEPTAPAGRRLPTARRERKPVLAVLAVLLIALGAVGGYYLVTQNAHRVAAIEIIQTVPAGQKIPLSAMTQVQVPTNTGIGYVPWNQASQVAGFYATSTLQPGTLLNKNMVSSTSTVPGAAGRYLLGLALKDGQLPDNLQVGDHVNIYEVSDANVACPGGGPGARLAGDALVTGINAPTANTGNSTTDVEVAVLPTQAGNVACSAANGIVGVVIVPAGGQQTGTG